MLEKLQEIKNRWQDVEMKLSDPQIISNMKEFTRLNREYKELSDIVKIFDQYKNVMDNIDFNKEVLATEKDEELKEMAKGDLLGLEEEQKKLEDDIKQMLVPKDPEDARNCTLEVRAGTGGDEASIFAGDLFRMYQRFCERHGFKVQVVDSNTGTMGGYKEVVMNVSGENAYGIMKFESGVHRVQRVPETEAAGRVHTSAASVVVMPEADDFDVDVQWKDIRIDTCCSSGAGGQSVNTTYSAVRLTHLPTGMVVNCQNERSQLANKESAYQVLRNRIYEIEFNKRMEADSNKRKSMVSGGDRSAKIRTYNYPQNRITDHRINMTVYNLTEFMSGDIKSMIDALQFAENAERLKEGGLAV